MRDTLLKLVEFREWMFEEGVPSSSLRDLDLLLHNLMNVLRARGELCGCCADCLDPAWGSSECDPADDEDDPQ